MINIYLITGFLGSGKTTFLVEQLKDCSKKTGVLMNEFGKISMDSVTVTQQDINLKELTNGSIFCACLKDKFIDGLIELVKLDLEDIYIESSGLSDPSNMEAVLEILNKEVSPDSFSYKGSICIVDGVYFFEELDKLVSVERQIKHSHLVLINKLDLIDGDKLGKIKSTIKEINHKALTCVTSFGKCEDIEHMDYFDIEAEETTNKEDNRPKQLLMSFESSPSLKQVSDFMKEVSSAFYRIKGFVEVDQQLRKIDCVNDRFDIIDYEWKSDNRLGYNELVFLSSQGLSSVSVLATGAKRHFPGLYKLSI